MKWIEMLQEIWKLCFEEVCGRWQKGRLSRGYAAGHFGDRDALPLTA